MADSAYSVARAQLYTVLAANGTIGSFVKYGWPADLGSEYVVVCDPPEEDEHQPHSLGTTATPGWIGETFRFWVVVRTSKTGRSSQEAVERREDLMDPVLTVLRANQGTINSTAAAAGVVSALIKRIARTEVGDAEGWVAQAVITIEVKAQI